MSRVDGIRSRVGRALHQRERLAQLEREVLRGDVQLLTTDVFDTVLLRDHTTEAQRLAAAARRAAPELGVDPGALARLRWEAHASGYRAVSMERPDGEASLTMMCAAVAASLGLGDGAAKTLHDAELAVDAEHLRPNRPLLAVFRRVRAAGVRVVAVSDTYYSEDDVRWLLATVTGADRTGGSSGGLGSRELPIDRVYSSADEGATKHRGGLYPLVAQRESVDPARAVHVGDHPSADVQRSREAGWTAVHLPREGAFRAAKILGGAAALPSALRRAR
ncbi:hypothetical protein SAMN06264364_10443 [Quadrisphaera granulorum]|uniref:Hydrolase of the HAD superfamily n=1 Tax=Quadrisphaera granulorum TaxID=317664 RepID=A0A316AC11_9ACTN|nr:hypothetical protein [Quadrisphaera granulorum]PWJ55122.1 hypothetical protein BXY45_10443 [Quadrisphaera granulorum]SZE95631.1 hypothetical protein SAMN06264364_10443 [Quadrisphaera granulorum]